MLTALLVIIYISFISLGLPDSLLGAAWPAMHEGLGAPLSFAGVIAMITQCGTVISSLLSVRVIKRFGTGRVTVVSVMMTAAALLGFSFAPSVWWLCLLAIPLGLGAGSVDAALNNFVALHYAARHMNWLHCFWGIGATAGPMVLSMWIAQNNNWQGGYLTIGIFQIILVAVLLVTLPLWTKSVGGKQGGGEEEEIRAMSLREIGGTSGAKPALLAFLCYCGVESTTNLWASSYATYGYGVSPERAAGWSAVFFFGITGGRLISGFLSIKLGDRQMVRLGEVIAVVGAVVLLLPLPVMRIPVALFLIGLGCAPIFPSMLHQTPEVFGKSASQAMMGVQMACAYTGATLLPPLFGAISEVVDIRIMPIFQLLLLGLMFLSTELVARRKKA